MKRFFLIVFICACALFAFVSNAEAQAPEGTYVTISYTYNRTTYYLAVNSSGDFITPAPTTPDDNCVWIQTANNAFWSVTAKQYLSISTSDPYSLILQVDPRPFTNNNGKLSFSQKSGNTTHYYYITFATNTFKGNRARNNANNAHTLSIKTADYNPYHNLTLVSPTQENVTVDQIKTIRLSADATIGSVKDVNNITLTNTTVNIPINVEVIIATNELVITTNSDTYKEGECTLTIQEGAVVGEDDVPFAEFTTSWTISPYTFTSANPNKPSVTVSELRKLRVLTNDKIEEIVDDSKIKLTNATNDNVINSVEIENNQLVITTTINKEGTYNLTISEGAIKGLYEIDFAEFTASWTISPYDFISATPNKTSVKASELKEIRVSAIDKIGSIANKNAITLPNATIEKVEIDNAKNQLVITATPSKDGEYKLTIPKGAVVGTDGVDFAGFTRTWTVSPYEFISATPNRITVTAADLKEIRVSAIDEIGQIANGENITLSNAQIENITIDEVTNQLVITTEEPFSTGECKLTIPKGAVVGADGVDFAGFTHSWTISLYKFISSTPNKSPVTASDLKEIRVLTNDEILSFDKDKISLTNGEIGSVVIENNQLVIATKVSAADITCVLTMEEGAVVGWGNMPFERYTRSWPISLYAFTSVNPKAGKAGVFSEIILTADVAIKQLPTTGFTLGTKKIGNGLTVALSDDKKQLTVTSNTLLNEGDYTLSIAKGAVVAEDGIDFAAATYNWTIVTTPQFIDVTPAVGDTYGFNTITLTASADIEETLRFGYYYPDNNQKIKFTHSLGSVVKTSYVGSGVGVKRIDNRTLEVIIPDNLGEGTYRLEIQDDAIQTKDQKNFAAATYTWTVNAHQFGTVLPATIEVGDHLEQITIPAADPTVAMSIPHDPDLIGQWITLTNAGGSVIPTTVAIVNNELVITPVAALGNGVYTLNVEKGAVVGPHSVPFVATSKTWNVVVSVAITHVKGFYPALGAGGYQNVHTVERTIYYTGNETSIPLTLAETNFFGYMRWYNYATDGGDDITWVTNQEPRGNGGNFVEIEGTAKHLGWFGWNRSNTTGNPVENGGDGGVLNNTENSNATPNINISGWTGNHTIACDVSHYLDYTVTRIDKNIVGITEPRLSYRQLFHFKPASEMAARVDACTGDTYLETYYYTAPTNTNVYLATEFHHSLDNNMLNNYFYNASNPTRITASDLKWYIGDTELTKDYDAKDFQTVSSSSTSTDAVTYTLRATIGTETYNIAKFVVTYVNKNTYGPVQETGTDGSAKALMSYAEMNAKFDVLEYNNFSFGQTPNSSAQQYLTTPLSYDQSTYGFSHMAADAIKPNDQYDVPYYGEYAIVNRIGDDYWEESANHVDGVVANVDQAAAQGFGIYVDGTTEPGVVASISTKVTICAERTMYCSVWLRNPRPSGQCGNSVYKPIFRCNVQGRNQLSNGEYTPWENVGVYFVGELPCASGWNQVNFPIESQETYSECRVQIYNFGTGGNGNDFWLDDLCIYADKLPMSSYQLQTEMCCSPNHDGTTFTAAVLRVDYGINTLHESGSNQYQYYQIYNKTTGQPFVLTGESLSPYYDEHQDYTAQGLTKEQYGSIEIMAANYTPSEAEIRNNPSELVGELLNAYHLDTKETKTAPLCGKCFVAKRQEEITTESPGQFYMYVVHIIPNIHDNRVKENYLQEHCQYTLRMTSEAEDLLDANLSCAIEIDLPATQESLYRLMSSQIETSEFLCNSTNNCPNEQYTIEAFIRKDSDPYSDAGEAEGTYLADWMFGHDFDEVYRMDYPHENDDAEHAAKDAADAKFAAAYHCSRAQVTDAFLDLRRPDEGNANYGAKTFAEIDPKEFSDYGTEGTESYSSKSKYYETIKYLHEQGWLQLASSTVSFYLRGDATARYWVFPIENSAKAEDDVTPLHDCPEPRWVQVSTRPSNYYVNVAPGVDVTDESYHLMADPRTGTRIPSARVLARLVNNTIQIPIHQSSVDNFEVHFMGADAYLFQTNDTQITNPTAVKYTCSKSDNMIVLIPATDNKVTLTIGKEYTMCVRMRDKADQHRAAGDNCDVGKIYVKLLILPDVVKWTPTTPDKSWHNDANWTGYGTGMENYHYAPIAGSNVIIPTAHYPELTVIANTNEDPHPYPMDANFALTPTCGQIYFEPGAMMLNQHLLQHDKALVDLKVRNMYWNTVAVPISSVVSGDMYIPHSGDETNGTLVSESEPFTVATFQGSRHSSSAFPFWMSVYNRTVERINENPAQNGKRISTNTAAFATTNSLNHPFEVGSGYQLLGWAANNLDLDSLIVRLPKPDNVYSYYDSEGYLADNVAINRGDNPNKLVYSPTTPVVLKNEIANQYYMFGNPTMSMIDMATLISERMQGATFYYMADDGWKAESATTAEITDGRYLKPMRSVLVRMPNASTEFSLNLDATYLTTPEKIKAGNDATHGLAPRRNTGSSELQLMTIYADSYGTKARCLLGAKPGMRDVYSVGEDAIFISSGVEAEVNSATATSPVNMYTVAKQVPLMVDVRENIDTVPLALLIQDIYRTPTIIFSFELTDNWNKECYLWDSKTDDRFLITDSLVLELEMSLDHETRYFILGPDDTTNDDISSSTDRPVLPQVDTPIQLWAYSAQSGQLQVNSNEIIKHVKVYDLTGRLVAQKALDLYGHSMTLSVPTGMCIVEATMRDNTKRRVQALVR